MKKLIIITIILILSQVSFAQDTLKTFTKIYNFHKPNTEAYRCLIIRNGETVDTVCERLENLPLSPQGQSQRNNSVILISRITDDSTMIILKQKIETDYQKDIKSFQELQMKIIKEESYLEILNYLIEEKKK